ncbi:hypothetical protein LXA43DRAFT_1031429 [Ganoderma leucocontextum]|nr:hypothetical protein LXA43DRAFT_1031429 [Ganoderma leucocontextum]
MARAGVQKLYARILKTAGPVLEQVVVHLRDHPDPPCLIYCTAGKDRSGIFSVAILKVREVFPGFSSSLF